MKHIALKRLELQDFKGIHALVLDFCGKSASIYGDNATGKTTIFDAWCWLLTGKDSLGRVAADNGGFDIKPLDQDGAVLDRATRSIVTGTVEVDGREITLRREYYEKWTEKRGSGQASYDGNTTDYYIDDVPKSKRQYDEAVTDLIPQDTLRILSDVTAFAKLDDKARREILFQVAGLGDELAILATDEQFAPLLAATETVSLSDYQKKVTIQRRKLNDQRRDIPARLDEVKKSIAGLAELPFDTLRESAEELEREKNRLDGELSASQEDRTAALRVQIGELQNQRTALVLENQKYRAEQQRQQPDRHETERALSQLKLSYRYDSDRYHTALRDAERYEAKLDAARSEWMSIKAEQYPGTATCPACGQSLPPERQAEARKTWQEYQKRRLDSAAEEGQRYKTLADKSKAQAGEVQERMISWENQIAQKQDELTALEAAPVPEIADREGYAQELAQLDAQLAAGCQALKEAQENAMAATSRVRRKRDAVADELRGIREQLAKEDTLRWAREREKALQDQTREISNQIAQADQTLDLLEEFTRYKAKYVTGTVNSLFRMAQFRLFRSQVNGGLVDCCDILCGGVPYGTGLNSGAKVNVGLDIINTLSQYYGYSVPIFVDNAESVTDLQAPVGAQVIRLLVSEADKKVRFEQ